ncbi:non-ribosomal peptide synthetase/type I polyketide synthase [Urbifossiella limnaea]|uniref:Phthiocerol synthesis polyketide synthase type I PpsE n=1 Tax=Urbifossiella limnaea TaxID=2528023 RepID=A0A517Y2Z6_9BACT|nr:non-ribosomal peptide synthetase/type I polyketide synthase [Urbifossiella limnaea]QDU24170.1 Phthiocerol synthesis polyketide synthase type I PpsE [Urbifossiella limnaea]
MSDHADAAAGLPSTDIAVVGMSGRWPGAGTPAHLWRNYRDGVECISRFPAEELEVAGAAEQNARPGYVRARSVLADVDQFDAGFFGILPTEAERLDPQFRIFLECCWEALEDAGYDPGAYPGAIGVIAGCAINTYLMRNLCTDRQSVEEFTAAYPMGKFATMLGAMADTLTSRVSYKLNLRGPSFTLLSTCSTSLVAVSQACQSLLSYQSDMVLTGGVAVTFPQKRGHVYQEGGMGTADGYCRPFEARATGTVFGSGAGVVLLKRLDDALAAGDHVYAVIKGFAVNNDGSGKVGYTAPSVDGQAQVIAQAQALAGVSPDTIGYLEAHGTATPLGDPIEFTALTRAFRAETQARQFCAIGTIKRNLGHLEMASGVTGLIAAAQALAHRQLPPAADFGEPNPHLDLANSPFYVNTRLAGWPAGSAPRRAGVSSFGLGGTNAHVVLEEAPPVPAPVARPAHLLLLSARSAAALEKATDNLASHLRDHPKADLAAVAYTLQAGRRAFDHRRAVRCTDAAEAVRALETRDRTRVQTRACTGAPAPVVFMFPGQGSQYTGMGAGLYESDAGFRADIDTCATLLQPHLGADLREALFAGPGAPLDLRQTRFAQPALFVLGYATARLWERWGVVPQAMIGHSVGEFVAATLAGVFALEDALAVVAARGRMAQEQPPGAMLSVRLSHAEVLPWLTDEISLAAVNAPQLSVVAGPDAAVAELEQKLAAAGVAAMRLATSHAFHSAMMDPVVGPFTDMLRGIRLNPPTRPILSSVTGDWLRPEEATDPAYWGRHLREAVLFSKCVEQLRAEPGRLLLEVGPGSVLCKLARQHRDAAGGPAVPSLPDAPGDRADSLTILAAAGTLWLHGVKPDWKAMAGPGARRCPLPTYPFERKRYWVDPPAPAAAAPTPVATPTPTLPPTLEPQPEAVVPAAAPARTGRLRAEIIDILQRLSGMDLAGTDGTTFLELGFDSLFLTQVAQELVNRFGVKVTFRQLLDQESSPDALAAYLDAKMPPDAPAVPAPAAVAAPAPAAVAPTVSAPQPVAALPAVQLTDGTGGLEGIIRAQLQAMSQLMANQLEVVRGGAPTAVATPTPAVIPVPVVSAPAPAAAAKPSANGTDTREYKAQGRFKSIQRGPTGGLTDRQKAHLDDLVRRMNAKTPGSKKLAQERRPILADPRTAAGFRSLWKEMVYPIAAVRSRGSKIWDVDGNEYIDLVNGFGPIMLGHSPDFVTEAVAAQLKEGFETGPSTPLAGECAELIRELTGNERTTFCNTGSEAVMAAMRLARTVTGRKKVVMFAGDYHGTFDEVLVKGVVRGGAPHSLPMAPGVCPEAVSNIVVLEYGEPSALEYIRANARELAAVMVEPVQSRHPGLRPVEFLREVRRITEDAGAALIIDEVVTGFRVHPGGVQALFDIRADLVTYGKVAGGGMPVGILCGKAKFMDALDGGMWQFGDDSFPEVGVTFFAGTFVRHPLAMAAVRAVLRHLKAAGPELQRKLGERVAALAHEVNGVFKEYGVPAEVEQFSSWFYFAFPSDQPYASLLHYHLREKGVFILEGFGCFLTTAHTEADYAAVVRAFQESAAELQAAGFLPEPAGAPPQPAPAPAADLPAEVLMTEPQFEILVSARLGDEETCAFNEAVALHFRGALDVPALRDSLTALVARHDALRATFEPGGETFRVRDPFPLDLPVVDLSDRPEADREAGLTERVRADAARPFDLAAGPLVRAALVKLGPDRHTLLFTSHHIVFDGWSANVVLDELAAIYAARVAGTAPALPPAPSFRQYALDQQRWKRSPERAAVEAWWVSKFQTPVTPLELPTDRPRGAVKSFNGDTARRTIGPEAAARVKKFGARQGCTLFATLLAGFKTLVHRLSGQSDIVVGIPAAGQSLLADSALVGQGVNFLPLRTSFDGDPAVGALLKAVRAMTLDAYDHQNYTFGSLVRKLAVRRDPSRLPLVEIQFNLEKLGAGLTFPGLEAEVDPCPKAFVNFDLFLNVVETPTGLLLDCDFNTDLFDRETVERWMGHFETLLESMAADPDQPVSAVNLLSDAERRRLVDEWNATQSDFPRDLCAHQLIEAQAARTPDAVAVVAGGRQLTYAELDRGANRLAHVLRGRGVGVGSRVAICLDRSPDMVVAVFGVLKAGAAYIPLDPEFPPERIAMVVEDADPALILTRREIAATLSLPAAKAVCVDATRPELEAAPDTRLPSAAAPSDLAYVIFTSGSTGKPKGVEIPHQAVVNFLVSMARQPGLGADDVLLAVTTLSFDIAVLELYLPLMVGGRVVVATRDDAMDGNRLLALLGSSGATVMQATPATWRLLLEAGWVGGTGLKVLCGGEALPRDLADELLARAGAVWNMYGPTETTVWSATSPVEPGPEPVRVGPPIANTEFYVLDGRGRPVPLGVAGELHIGGDGLARGYWNRPELTTDRFVADSFRPAPGRRLYKTGDLVRPRADGTLEFLGRLDNQVKIRGFRIETGDVEAAIKRYAGLVDCVVVVREDVPGHKQLVAYIVAAGAPPSPADLRRHLGALLPGYMVPSAFVPLAALPQTPNGKIDRRALPAPEAAVAAAGERVLPRTEEQKLLADVCAAVLKQPAVYLDDNLFDLGLDSLRLFQIVARAKDRGLNLTVKQILTGQTVAVISAGLASAAAQPAEPALVAARRDNYRFNRPKTEVLG